MTSRAVTFKFVFIDPILSCKKTVNLIDGIRGSMRMQQI